MADVIPTEIEREILIDAPLDVVWRIITDPAQIVQWFSEEAELDLRPDGEGRLGFKSGKSKSIHIEKVNPPHAFAFRWEYANGSRPTPTNSTLVEFTLRSHADKTLLRVVETGFDLVDWKDGKNTVVDDHTAGWETCLAQLHDLAVRLSRTHRGA